jgi:hypothetical protein
LDYLLHRTFKVTAAPTAFEVQELEFPAFMAGSGVAPSARAEYAA